jgi:hypothetical protein
VGGARRSLPRALIPALVVLAIVGYLLGVHRSSAPSTPVGSRAQQVASGASVLLEYPASWQPAASPPALPGLTFTNPLSLAPGGRTADAGLLGGQLPAGAPSPLPRSFLALVHDVPDVEVVNLAHLQAYRFGGLSGYGRTLQLYVIPTVAGRPTALVCYASSRSSGSSGYLNQCGQIVASATLVAQTTYELSPSATYAGQLANVLTALDRERLTLRGEIHASTASSTAGTAASALAERFAGAVKALTAIEAPQAASAAQAALVAALKEAHAAYAALAAAADSGATVGYGAAEALVDAAEARVDSALENYALLGYNHT